MVDWTDLRTENGDLTDYQMIDFRSNQMDQDRGT